MRVFVRKVNRKPDKKVNKKPTRKRFQQIKPHPKAEHTVPCETAEWNTGTDIPISWTPKSIRKQAKETVTKNFKAGFILKSVYYSMLKTIDNEYLKHRRVACRKIIPRGESNVPF